MIGMVIPGISMSGVFPPVLPVAKVKSYIIVEFTTNQKQLYTKKLNQSIIVEVSGKNNQQVELTCKNTLELNTKQKPTIRCSMSSNQIEVELGKIVPRIILSSKFILETKMDNSTKTLLENKPFGLETKLGKTKHLSGYIKVEFLNV